MKYEKCLLDFPVGTLMTLPKQCSLARYSCTSCWLNKNISLPCAHPLMEMDAFSLIGGTDTSCACKITGVSAEWMGQSPNIVSWRLNRIRERGYILGSKLSAPLGQLQPKRKKDHHYAGKRWIQGEGLEEQRETIEGEKELWQNMGYGFNC